MIIEVVEKAFVDIVIEQSFERDSLLVACRRTKLRIEIPMLELMEAPSMPSPHLAEFPLWVRANFLNKPIYVAYRT